MRTERGAAALTEIIVNAAAPLDCLREDFQSEEGINLTQQYQYHEQRRCELEAGVEELLRNELVVVQSNFCLLYTSRCV